MDAEMMLVEVGELAADETHSKAVNILSLMIQQRHTEPRPLNLGEVVRRRLGLPANYLSLHDTKNGKHARAYNRKNN